MTNATPHYIVQSWPTTRQWDRANMNAPLTLMAGPTTYRGWCTDVSEGGIGFTCAAPLQPGDEISITLPLDNLGQVEARGVVRHSAAFRCGCEFLYIAPSEQQMIANYVRAWLLKHCQRTV